MFLCIFTLCALQPSCDLCVLCLQPPHTCDVLMFSVTTDFLLLSGLVGLFTYTNLCTVLGHIFYFFILRAAGLGFLL